MRKDWLTGVTVVGTGLTAALVFSRYLADELPFGADSASAAECIFGSGRGVPPVWGGLLHLCWSSFGGTAPFRLGLASALAGGIAVGAIAYMALRAFAQAIANLNEDSRLNDPFLALAGPVAAFFFVSIPEVFTAATHVGPYTMQLALAFLAMAMTFGRVSSTGENASNRFSTLATGFVATMAAFEGPAGLVALPFVVALAWFDSIKRRQMRPTFAFVWLAFGFALAIGLTLLSGWTVPTRIVGIRLSVIWLIVAVVAGTAIYKSVRRRGVTVVAFVQLAGALAVAGVQTSMCISHRGEGRAADAYVRGLLKEVEGRRWLVSDGAFDAILRFYLPPATHLVTFAREHDKVHGEEIVQWMCEELSEADDDLLLAADLGPTRSVGIWMSRPEVVTNCAFATIFEPPTDGAQARRICPLPFCWRPEAGDVDGTAAEKAWRDAWAKMAPLLERHEPAADLIRRRFAAIGNAIGTLLQEAGQTELAWATYAFVRKEMDKKNLSLLLNMDGMARRGLAGDASVARMVAREVITELSGINDMNGLRSRLAEGGRLYVPQDVRHRLTESVRTRHRAFWEKPSGRLLRMGLDRLKAAESLTGKPRLDELNAIAKVTKPALDDPAVAVWLKDLFIGQLAQLRGGSELAEAQRRYQAVLNRGEGDVKLAFNRLLAVDMALGDMDALENDALRILRREPGHALASALAGSARLMRGENASALRFLGNAERLGLRSAAVLNDMALALSRLGRRDESIDMAKRALEADPENPHVRATLDEVTKNKTTGK